MAKKICKYSLIFLILSFSSVISCKKDLGVDLNGMPPPSGPPPKLIINVVWEVGIEMWGFTDPNLVIYAGDSVKWVSYYNNNGDHTITADDSSFYSGTILLGGIYERVFSDIGTYRYHCSVHSTEQGAISVIKDPNRP